MRKQRLPKDFWTGLSPSNTHTYCFWYSNDQLKKCQVLTQKEARDFVSRAKERNVAAFASTYVEEETENQIFTCSFKGVLSKYETVDYIQLEIASANYKLIHHHEKKAEQDSKKHCLEQWNKKEYGTKYEDAEYRISWYDTNKHLFKEEIFADFQSADTAFEQKKKEDIPVRLIECSKNSRKIHEIKAACQHWFIGMGKYLEQAAKKSLPIGEIPYIFSNSYLTSELEVDEKHGYLDFNVGFNKYSIQICRSSFGVSINICDVLKVETLYYVVIEDNPVLGPWLARIERQR